MPNLSEKQGKITGLILLLSHYDKIISGLYCFFYTHHEKEIWPPQARVGGGELPFW
jgi:hypothetical protein